MSQVCSCQCNIPLVFFSFISYFHQPFVLSCLYYLYRSSLPVTPDTRLYYIGVYIPPVQYLPPSVEVQNPTITPGRSFLLFFPLSSDFLYIFFLHITSLTPYTLRGCCLNYRQNVNMHYWARRFTSSSTQLPIFHFSSLNYTLTHSFISFIIFLNSLLS